MRRAKRMFRLSRITQLAMTEDTFHPRNESQTEEETQEVQGTLTHLRFDPNVQVRVMEQFSGEYKHHGAYIDVHKVFYQREYAISVVLSYGSKVEIISPADLKDELLQEITIFVDSSTMPKWMGTLVNLNPISIATNTVRDLFHGTATLLDVLPGIGLCVLLIGIFAPLTLYLYLTKPNRG